MAKGVKRYKPILPEELERLRKMPDYLAEFLNVIGHRQEQMEARVRRLKALAADLKANYEQIDKRINGDGDMHPAMPHPNDYTPRLTAEAIEETFKFLYDAPFDMDVVQVQLLFEDLYWKCRQAARVKADL